MKNTKTLTLVLFLLFYAITVFAQEKEVKYQAYNVNEDQVKPSMVTEYEETLKEYMAFFKEYEFKHPCYLYKTDDFYYYYMTPVGLAYAYLDSLNSDFNDVISKNSDKFQKIFKKFDGTYYYNKSYALIRDSELSYSPEKTDICQYEKHYVDLTCLYLKVGKTDEFKVLCKQLVELYKKNSIPLSFTTFIGGNGTEQPYYIWASLGKDRLDFWTKNEIVNKTFKDNKEAEELWKKILKTVRKIEYKSEYFLPDLSYFPDNK